MRKLSCEGNWMLGVVLLSLHNARGQIVSAETTLWICVIDPSCLVLFYFVNLEKSSFVECLLSSGYCANKS